MRPQNAAGSRAPPAQLVPRPEKQADVGKINVYEGALTENQCARRALRGRLYARVASCADARRRRLCARSCFFDSDGDGVIDYVNGQYGAQGLRALRSADAHPLACR
jgi:hypothetical protein